MFVLGRRLLPNPSWVRRCTLRGVQENLSRVRSDAWTIPWKHSCFRYENVCVSDLGLCANGHGGGNRQRESEGVVLVGEWFLSYVRKEIQSSRYLLNHGTHGSWSSKESP